MKNKKIVILLIVIDIIIITGIYNFISKNTNIKKEKQIIKEMNESTQVEELNNQINALNTEHTEYMNYIQTGKTKIATALANEGVATSNEATLETMAENISKVLQAKTSDATATANDIEEGKIAYANGQKIIGTNTNNNGVGIILHASISINKNSYDIIDTSFCNIASSYITIDANTNQIQIKKDIKNVIIIGDRYYKNTYLNDELIISNQFSFVNSNTYYITDLAKGDIITIQNEDTTANYTLIIGTINQEYSVE